MLTRTLGDTLAHDHFHLIEGYALVLGGCTALTSQDITIGFALLGCAETATTRAAARSNQAQPSETRPAPGQITDLAARPQHESGNPHPRFDAPPESLGGTPMLPLTRSARFRAQARLITPLRAPNTRKAAKPREVDIKKRTKRVRIVLGRLWPGVGARLRLGLPGRASNDSPRAPPRCGGAPAAVRTHPEHAPDGPDTGGHRPGPPGRTGRRRHGQPKHHHKPTSLIDLLKTPMDF